MTDAPTDYVHPGRLERVDGGEALPFSRELIVATFAERFWYALNDKYALLIDEYEEQEIPVRLLEAVASDIRRFAEEITSSEVLHGELDTLADFLDHSRASGTAVLVIL